ncbi:hypothetical protein KC19_12G123900 [Ceratodon purpureus]|uniref:Uncharacterized protein n=1 Tax=Ceratodon purpureus TaxID=3225 RepID=A0A8T0G7D4_CERPU|nr:hypothetical protein KC19_12G123900 [Ceratodon purpureus]
MATTQAAQNMPHKLGGGEHEHPRLTRSPICTGDRSGPAHRLRTEQYEYNSMSDNVPPAGEYLRAPVCCSECEEFWKALILEVDEKHTSRLPAGKASLVMAKGASGSVLQIKSTKHVAKERRFFPGLGCKSLTVRGDAFHSCQPRVSQISSNRGHEYPQRKLHITTMQSNHVAPTYSTPSYAEPVLSRQFESQKSLQRSAVGYNTYGAPPKHDVISTPRRGHGHMSHTDRPGSAGYPQPPENSPRFTPIRSHQFSNTSSEASQAHIRGDRPHAHPTQGLQHLKPIRTHIDGGRSEEGFSHLSTPRRYAPTYNDNPSGSQSARYPSYADSSQLRPFPRPASSVFQTPNPRAQPREFLSHPSTPRMYTPMYTPMSQTPRGSPLPQSRVEEFLHHNFPTTPLTPGSSQRRDTQVGNSRGGSSWPSPLTQPHNIDTASPKHQSGQESSESANLTPNPGRDRKDIPLERKLSRTSTIESGYTSLSIPRSNCSASSSDSQELDSPPPSPRSKLARGRIFHTKNHRPQDLLRNNLSRTSTSTSSLMEPIVLFTGYGCRSETDENSEDEDVVITNPNYFKHIIANPNYVKHIIKPQAPTPKEDLPKDMKTA